MHFCSSENVTKKLVLSYKSCNMKYAHEEDLEAKFTFVWPIPKCPHLFWATQ